ncbi:MAG TPA: hypothetical protein VKA67_01750, partial [Verrucomicrobiae bacterium]|nr:hypothetical protein [Verrucomicrobiae bacterium]
MTLRPANCFVQRKLGAKWVRNTVWQRLHEADESLNSQAPSSKEIAIRKAELGSNSKRSFVHLGSRHNRTQNSSPRYSKGRGRFRAGFIEMLAMSN